MPQLPLLLQPIELAAQLNNPELLILDLGKESVYQQAHIPGAINVNGKQFVSGQLPAPGKLPSLEQLSAALSAVGLTPEKHVVVYDDEGGGWAGRLIWTLDLLGHSKYSYLNGGIHAWLQEGLATDANPSTPTPSQYVATVANPEPSADLAYVLAHHNDGQHIVWDARSPEEYAGTRVLAQRAGHIPGAQNYEWTRAMDRENGLRVRDLEAIRAELAALGIDNGKTIITHCQTHHRSGFTYLIGKLLGFEKLKAYPGSWSEWGNTPDTPITQ